MFTISILAGTRSPTPGLNETFPDIPSNVTFRMLSNSKLRSSLVL